MMEMGWKLEITTVVLYSEVAERHLIFEIVEIWDKKIVVIILQDHTTANKQWKKNYK